MDVIKENIKRPFGKDTVNTINKNSKQPLDSRTISELNKGYYKPERQEQSGYYRQNGSQNHNVQLGQTTSLNVKKEFAPPVLKTRLKKGQKTPISKNGKMFDRLKIGFGWDVRDSRCDVDASVFMLDDTGKVPGEDWFVFYGQTESPDHSVKFTEDMTDREIVTVDFRKLDKRIRRIVIVVTINEAFENRLNFSMLKDVYMRVMDPDTGEELVSYSPEEYFSSITSMTVGEIYLHNGTWKFNPVGNGVNRDLAGQCELYGIEAV